MGRAAHVVASGAQTELIQIDVIVAGKGGVRVLGLTREDFMVLEDGKPQTITHFARRAVPGFGGTTLATDKPAPASADQPLPELDVQGRRMVVAVDTQSLQPSTFLNMKQKLGFVDEPKQRARSPSRSRGPGGPRRSPPMARLLALPAAHALDVIEQLADHAFRQGRCREGRVRRSLGRPKSLAGLRSHVEGVDGGSDLSRALV